MNPPSPHRIDSAGRLAPPALDRRNPPSSSGGGKRRPPNLPSTTGANQSEHARNDADVLSDAGSFELAGQLLHRHAADLIRQLQDWGADLDDREAELEDRATSLTREKRRLQLSSSRD